MQESACGKASSSNGTSSQESFDCANCGAEVLRYPSQIEPGRNYFCDRGCMAEFQDTSVEVTCAYCSDTLRLPEWRLSKSEHHFCSDECFDTWQSEYRRGENHPHWKGDGVETECGWCGDSMTIRPHRDRINEIVFCCNDHFRAWHSDTFRGEDHPVWKGGHTKYRGPNWDRVRKRVLRRDDHACMVCGVTAEEIGRSPDVHHIEPYRNFESWDRANRLSNLIALCPEDHGKAESGELSKAELRDLLPEHIPLGCF